MNPISTDPFQKEKFRREREREGVMNEGKVRILHLFYIRIDSGQGQASRVMEE